MHSNYATDKETQFKCKEKILILLKNKIFIENLLSSEFFKRIVFPILCLKNILNIETPKSIKNILPFVSLLFYENILKENIYFQVSNKNIKILACVFKFRCDCCVAQRILHCIKLSRMTRCGMHHITAVMF